MNKAKIQVMPGLMFGTKGDIVLLEEKVEDGETVEDLLSRLGSKHKGLGEVVLDRESGKLTGQVIIVLNNQFLELQGGTGKANRRRRQHNFSAGVCRRVVIEGER